MFARLVLVCAGIVLLPSATVAQDAPATPPAADRPLTRADLEIFAKRIEDSVTKRVEDSLAQGLREQNSRINRLEEDMKHLSDFHQGQQQVLEQIAKRDNSGKSYLRIDASHEPTRNELRRAIEEAAPKTGTVTIRNAMNCDQEVGINGVMHKVFAKHDIKVTVAYGDFKVQLENRPLATKSFSYPSTETTFTIRPEYPRWVSGTPGYWTFASQ